MSKKTILVAAPVVVGLPILFWAALAARGERAGAPAKGPKPTPVVRKMPSDAGEAGSIAPSIDSSSRSIPSSASPETFAILDRVRRMEDRVRDLEAKRESLASDNKDLEKQLTEKSAEINARTMAEWRVRSWEALLGLSETQRKGLTDLLTQWGKEDAGRPPNHDSWAAREAEVRAQLTAEQSAKLHDTAVSQAQQQWKFMGMSVGSMVGASKDEQTRLQQSLGDVRFPQDMMLPEAHGGDYNSLMREAVSRARPMLTADQTARLDKFGWK